MKICFWLISSMVINLFATSIALADEWRMFGAHGMVQLTPRGGEPTIIDNDKSLMIKITNSSTIQVKGKGKVVLVSLKSRKAFEIGDNSTAIVEPDIVRALSGVVNPKSGFAQPAGKSGKIGGVVMRGAGNQGGCLKAISSHHSVCRVRMSKTSATTRGLTLFQRLACSRYAYRLRRCPLQLEQTPNPLI